MSINLKVSVSLRAPKGRFPKGELSKATSAAKSGMRQDVEKAFRTQSNPVTGKRWPARRAVYPWPMLQKSGAMRSAYLAAAGAAAVRGGTVTMRLPADPPYSKYHWTGTARMVARKAAGVSQATKKRVRAALKKGGKKGLKVY